MSLRYLPPLNKAAKIEYVNKVKSMAADLGLADDFGGKPTQVRWTPTCCD